MTTNILQAKRMNLWRDLGGLICPLCGNRLAVMEGIIFCLNCEVTSEPPFDRWEALPGRAVDA